jgi:hypothetical protein
VLVIGPLKSRSFLLAHVASFKAGRYGGGGAAVRLVPTKAGEEAHGIGPRGATLLWATQRGVFNGNVKKKIASLEPIAAEMNSVLARARSNHG